MSQGESKYMELSYVQLTPVVDEVEKEKEYVLIDMHRKELNDKFEEPKEFDEEYKILKEYFGIRFSPITDNVFRMITYPDGYEYDFESNKNDLIELYLQQLKKRTQNVRYHKNYYKPQTYTYNSLASKYTPYSSWASGNNYTTCAILKSSLEHHKKKFKTHVLSQIEKDRSKKCFYITYGIDRDKYPKKPPDIYIDDTKNLLSKQNVEDLNNKIKDFTQQMIGKNSFYRVEAFVSHYLSNIPYLPNSRFSVTAVMDAVSKLNETKTNERLSKYDERIKYPDFEEMDTPEKFIGDIYGIIKKMPADITIKNVETILRQDLLWRFKKFKQYLKDKYPKHPRLSEIEIAFHGTRTDRLDGIVEKGLMIPNRGNGLDAVSCGARYGKGIYLSPDADFSMHYCRGDTCLLVCAVLPGKKHICSANRWDSQLEEGCDSHVSADKTELIVFDEAQILPCVVIHYEQSENTRIFGEKRVKYRDQMKTMNEKEKKEFLASFGQSLLPYGFGKAKNCEFLDVTFPDDDDDDVTWYGDMDNEHYNMFQEQRYKYPIPTYQKDS